jgi:Cu(I)/Ag(I) efflux system membrane fusion protein
MSRNTLGRLLMNRRTLAWTLAAAALLAGAVASAWQLGKRQAQQAAPSAAASDTAATAANTAANAAANTATSAATSTGATGEPQKAGDIDPATGKRVLYWHDPMVPGQRFDRPGKSPFMDMMLVPKYADDAGGSGVRIDPRLAQSLGMRVATVTRERLAPSVEAVASVTLNDRDVAIVQTRSGGFVERAYPHAPGDVISAGAPLVDLLVPEWLGAQEEFLELRRAGDDALADAARDRLRALGLSEAMIRDLERRGEARGVVTITAPIGGVVQELGVRAGMTIAPGTLVARVNGLATVWLEAAVPEAQASMLTTGQRVRARLAAYPGETFEGRIAAVLPETNRETRTLRVRMEFPNRGLKLRPGMYAQVALSGAAEQALVVPSDAVIRTGKRAVVFVVNPDDPSRYTPVAVELGREIDGKLVVRSGLSEGQQVVASGQFLLDSEASLAGVMARGAAESK